MLAIVDDFNPAAVEERRTSIRVFFFTTAAREQALAALVAANYPALAVDVDDEDWARRSKESLAPVTVGRITIFPNPESQVPNPDTIPITIAPSMGFGTGHHATTRLCLEALQSVDLTNRVVLDVGTGSGVLAIASVRLGAARAIGIENDPDALRSARENLGLNPAADRVEFRPDDLNAAVLPPSDLVIANLTGALLVRAARSLVSAVRPGGTLIVSGLLIDEKARALDAFAPARTTWERTEEGWVGLAIEFPAVK